MIEYLKKFAATHIFYLILIAGGAVAFHSWLSEHDARLQADQTVKAAEIQVKASQDQIIALQAQIATNDARAQQQLDALAKVIQSVKTSQQAAVALPTVADLPVPIQVQPDQGWLIPPADVLPLFNQLAEGKVAETKLTQCQADYTAEQQIAAKKDDQLKEKDGEIAALKQKPSFWNRVKGTLKTVGIGVGIGIAIGAHGL